MKKGSGINSIFEKLKTLARKNGSEDSSLSVFNADDEEETHISFTAEDSVEPESHSVTIYDKNGSEGEPVPSTESSQKEDFDAVSVPIINSEQPEYLGEVYEVSVENEIELPPMAPEFVSDGIEAPLESPEPVIEDTSDILNGDYERYEAVSEDKAGGYKEMYDENEMNSVPGNEWESEDANQDLQAERDTNRAEAEIDGNSGTSRETVLELTSEDLESISSPVDFVNQLNQKGVKAGMFVKKLRYEEKLRALQHECAKFQQSVKRNNERVIVIFEGMELAGKFDTIRKFTKFMDPRGVRTVSLGERSHDEKQEWFFNRYTKHLPKPGELVFFNRSWYERGVLEPVHGLCTDEEYGHFLTQAPEFEYMLIEEGYKIIKIWLSVSSKQQNQRLHAIAKEGLMNWKLSPFDDSYLQRWAEANKYRNMMFSWTDKNYSPWVIISSKKRKKARLEAMRHVLSTLEYDGKQDATVSLVPNAKIVSRFHRSMMNEE